MKPIRLTMQAFGAYRERTELDFGELKGGTFFLIHGPTGSGKTTILDAICFALYGETSGQARTAKTVRSDFADAKLRTYVDLVFSVGQNVYRVERSPEQERAKVRGTGTMIEKPQATLWQVEENGEKILAGNTRSVTEKIEAMLGFECSQFRQVVLLPQGEFRKLLLANSVERQEIMQTLFRTELYEKIEQRLKEKASGVKKQFEALEQERRLLLEASGADSEEALSQKIEETKREEAALAALVKEKNTALKQAEKLLDDGRRIDALFSEEKQAQEAELKAVAARTDAQPLRAEWDTAVRAQKLRAPEEYLKQEEKALVAKRSALVAQEEALTRAKQAIAAAERTYKAEKARESERQEARVVRSELDKKTEVVRQLAEAQKTYRTSENVMLSAKAEKDKKEKDCDTYTKALEELRKEREAKLSLAKEAAKLAQERERLSSLLKTRQDFDSILRDLAEDEKKIKQKSEETHRLDRRAREAEEAFHQTEARWQRAQAGVLAQSLAEDAPCPVCGATHHPHLAPLGQAPSEAERKAVKQKAETLRKEHTTENLALAALMAGQEARQKRKDELLLRLGDSASDAKTLAEQAEAVKKRAQEAQSAAEEAETLKKRIEKGDAILIDTKKACEAAKEKYQKAHGTWMSAKAIVQERQSQVPAELMAEGALDRAKRIADKRIAELDGAWQKAETSYQNAQASLVKADTDTLQKQSAVKEQTAKCQTLLQDLLRDAGALGFASREAMLDGARTDQWLKETETRLKQLDEAVSSARDRHARAKQATAGLVLPALDELLAAKRAAEEAHLSAVKEHRTKQDAIGAQQDSQKKIADCAAKIDRLQEGYRVVGQLAQVAGGDNEKKLTFQRFVLSELLTEVAEVASQRLLKMSRRRYALRRTDERARKNAAGGLELEVFDNDTGAARPVGTLSGGESFLASLALALGLADVVQSYAGGIRLDTMLIDEGFGTLDPEMLDFAVKTLLELQQGGRLVGIISHVPELKERIDARLEVRQTKQGSTAAFCIG